MSWGIYMNSSSHNTEPIEERIDDLQNYLGLLRGLIRESAPAQNSSIILCPVCREEVPVKNYHHTHIVE